MVFRREFLASGIGERRIIRPDVSAQIFRQRIEIVAVRLDDLGDIADGVEKVAALGQWKFRRFAGELFQRGIRPEEHGQFAELRRLFKKPQVARLDVVKPAADYDVYWVTHFLETRTFTWKAPGTGISETTIR